MNKLFPMAAFFGALFVNNCAIGEVSDQELRSVVVKVEDKVIQWRRDIHQHPELSNREFRTSSLVAEHLKRLGLELRTNIAHTGVTAVLRGGKPGPTIALRADMDALPVTEQVDVSFKSTLTGEYLGKKVGIMHACGHDAHTAILMGIAEVLVAVREELPGTVLFVFQPAEEGAPEGEQGGAFLMMQEGVFSEVKPAAIFGLHMMSAIPSGVVVYRSGPFMAGADAFRIEVKGRQAHGSRPWAGVDPIVIASQIVMGLQTIVSRQVDISKLPAVVTVGKFDGGVRSNIIPDAVEMQGTIRTFDAKVRADIIARIERTTQSIAAASGALAQFTLVSNPIPVVYNDPILTQRVLPSLWKAVGANAVQEVSLQTAAEDFSFYTTQAPAFFFHVGVMPPGMDPEKAPSIHSPQFYIDEPAILAGLRALLAVAVDYLQTQQD